MNIQEPVSEITGFRGADFRDSGQLVSEALRLKAGERLAIVDALLRSLDQPDPDMPCAVAIVRVGLSPAGCNARRKLRRVVFPTQAICNAAVRPPEAIQPDNCHCTRHIDRLWADEAERRLMDYRAGKVKGIPAEAIFGDN